MKKLTIAELREREVKRLAMYHAENPDADDIIIARQLMHRFYRLCGLCETNLYLSNNERTCNTKYTEESENKESRLYNKLKKDFQDFSGLTLVYCGYCPSIGILHAEGGFSEKISRYFYN